MKMRDEAGNPRLRGPLARRTRENPPRPMRTFEVQLWHGDLSPMGDGKRNFLFAHEVMSDTEGNAAVLGAKIFAAEARALIPDLDREIVLGNAKWVVERK